MSERERKMLSHRPAATGSGGVRSDPMVSTSPDESPFPKPMTSAAARREYSPRVPPRPSSRKPAAMMERARQVVVRRPAWSMSQPAAPLSVRSTTFPALVKAPTSTAPNPRLCTASGMASMRPWRSSCMAKQPMPAVSSSLRLVTSTPHCSPSSRLVASTHRASGMYMARCPHSTSSRVSMEALRLRPLGSSHGSGTRWKPAPLTQMGMSSASTAAAVQKPAIWPPLWKRYPPREGPRTTETRAVAPKRLITRPRCDPGMTIRVYA
mmetsp:Transcript_22871/g.50167  ORF Transcript_22871/g.50167 Transcript_22871/m.50167 type:complete len:266 (-) Transcript_22871:674-1471(-)